MPKMRGKAREDIKNWSHHLSRNSTWLSNSQRKLKKWLPPTLYSRDKTKAMKARKKGPNISPSLVRQSASVNENSLPINLRLHSPILILIAFSLMRIQPTYEELSPGY